MAINDITVKFFSVPRPWLNEGGVPDRKVGGTWYVDEHAWLADRNELALRVLDAG